MLGLENLQNVLYLGLPRSCITTILRIVATLLICGRRRRKFGNGVNSAVISAVFKDCRVEHRKIVILGFLFFRRGHVRFIHISIKPRHVQVKLAFWSIGDIPPKTEKSGYGEKQQYNKNPKQYFKRYFSCPSLAVNFWLMLRQ